MRKIILTVGTAVLLLPKIYAGGDLLPIVAPVALENPVPWYVGAGIVIGKFSDCNNGCSYEDVTYGGMVRGGYEWNQYIGIEARAIRTFLAVDEFGGEELQNIGIFAKPSYPVGEDFNIYALLGYGWTKSITSNRFLPSIEANGFSWGFGLEYDLSEKEDDRIENGNYDREFDGQADQEKGWGVFLDYQKLIVDSALPNMQVISIGVTYDF